MKTILICKDCLAGQEEALARYKNDSQINIFFTGCMDICPSGKISVIELNKESLNSIVPKSLTMNEVINRLDSNKVSN